MKADHKTYKDTELINYPKPVTVGEVEELLLQNNDAAKKRLVYVIYHRLNNRYVVPLDNIPDRNRSGFLTMAVSCLMIEAFQSFREGLEFTRATGAGKQRFVNFFTDYEAFKALRPVSEDFYYKIRCGILHQAETYGNWLIVRRPGSPLFNPTRPAINADAFFEELKKYFHDYCHGLENSDWNSPPWKAARKKLKFICDHCNVV